MRLSQVAIAVCMGFIVPASVGYLSGWLVGASQTPVVSTVVPLVFGLLGIAGIGTVTKWFTATSIIDTVFNKAGSERRTPQLNSELEEAASDIVRWPAMVTLSIATLVFCSAFFIGMTSAMERRIVSYPSLSVDLENIALRPYEAAALSRLRLDWLASGVPHSDFQFLLRSTFVPIFQRNPVEHFFLLEPNGEMSGSSNDVRFVEFHFALTAAQGRSPTSQASKPAAGAAPAGPPTPPAPIGPPKIPTFNPSA